MRFYVCIHILCAFPFKSTSRIIIQLFISPSRIRQSKQIQKDALMTFTFVFFLKEKECTYGFRSEIVTRRCTANA